MKALAASFSILFLALPAAAQQSLTIEVTGGKRDQRNVPIRVPLSKPEALAKASIVQLREGDKAVAVGQLVASNEKEAGRDLVFILPELKAGATRTFTVEPLNDATTASRLAWVKKTPGYTDLMLEGDGARPVMRYMHLPFDDSTKAKRDRSYKVFHHLWHPAGNRFVTNGGHTDPHEDPKKLLFPHHRGLMFAFNRISYNGKKADTWHAAGDAHQSHEKFLNEEAGPVVGSHRALINWHGEKKEVFAKEERQMTVYNVPGGTLLDNEIVLRTTGGKVRLDGDPQHAGFQFRAANDLVIEGNAKLTYYLRPDGKGKPGQTRNWDPRSKKGPVNLPWNVLSFVLDGQRYSVALIDHPDNPAERRHSERDYGRFGSYFEYDLTKENPLRLRHRVWLQAGEMTADQVEALRESFAEPPRVTVK